MPVTAKLSRKFYDRLGDDIANELVDWFNAVDDTYRTQLRELNELNWNRFQAAMDARFAESDLKMERRFAAADLKMEQRVAALEVKMDQRFAAVDLRLASVEARFTDQAKWFIGVWLGTVIPIAGMILGLFNSIR